MKSIKPRDEIIRCAYPDMDRQPSIGHFFYKKLLFFVIYALNAWLLGRKKLT